MNRRNPDLNAVTRELDAAGIEYTVTKGRHLHIRWLSPTGQARLCVVAVSPSLQSSALNARSTVRRILRTDQQSV